MRTGFGLAVHAPGPGRSLPRTGRFLTRMNRRCGVRAHPVRGRSAPVEPGQCLEQRPVELLGPLQLRVVADQMGAPTGADLIADVTAHALRQAMAQPAFCGTYHLASAGETSWHGYAQHVLRQAATLGQALKVAPEAVEAIPTSAYPTPARRPLNSRLNTEKLTRAFGLRMPPWQAGVDRMLREWLGN